MVNMMTFPVSMSHAKDRIANNIKYSAKGIAVTGITAGTAYALAPKVTTQAAKTLVSGISNYAPASTNLLGKFSGHLKNGLEQLSRSWNVLPPRAKAVIGIGFAALSLLGLKGLYERGNIDGRHQTVKELIKSTNETGLYV